VIVRTSSGSGSTWSVTAENTGASAATIQAFAICATASP
jgi:hypothetical protein